MICYLIVYKFEILKNRLSKSGCHGNVKLNRQGRTTPNCSQLNFRKSHQVRWLYLAYQKSYKLPKSLRAESAPPPPPPARSE